MSCFQNFDCPSTGWCDRGVCRTASKEGDFCKNDSNCPSNLKCHFTIKRCKSNNFKYGKCSNSKGCMEGWHCSGSKCKIGASAGEGCSSDDDCFSRLSCYQGKCTNRCKDKYKCFGSGLDCVWNSSAGYNLCIPEEKKSSSDTGAKEKKDKKKASDDASSQPSQQQPPQQAPAPSQTPTHDDGRATSAQIFNRIALFIFGLIVIVGIIALIVWLVRRKSGSSHPPPPPAPTFVVATPSPQVQYVSSPHYAQAPPPYGHSPYGQQGYPPPAPPKY